MYGRHFCGRMKDATSANRQRAARRLLDGPFCRGQINKLQNTVLEVQPILIRHFKFKGVKVCRSHNDLAVTDCDNNFQSLIAHDYKHKTRKIHSHTKETAKQA